MSRELLVDSWKRSHAKTLIQEIAPGMETGANKGHRDKNVKEYVTSLFFSVSSSYSPVTQCEFFLVFSEATTPGN